MLSDLRFKVEYYVLWDDHTWEDCHFHVLTMSVEDITAMDDSDMLAYAEIHGRTTLIRAPRYGAAVMLIPAMVEVLQNEEDS